MITKIFIFGTVPYWTVRHYVSSFVSENKTSHQKIGHPFFKKKVLHVIALIPCGRITGGLKVQVRYHS